MATWGCRCDGGKSQKTVGAASPCRAESNTADHLAQIEGLINQKISEVRNILAQFDQQQPFQSQIEAVVEAGGLTAAEWQATPLLIVPPALNFIAVALLAELHGLMGHFPDCVRLRPVEGARPPRFEVAEILNLQAYREAGRNSRVVNCERE